MTIVCPNCLYETKQESQGIFTCKNENCEFKFQIISWNNPKKWINFKGV